MYVRMYVCVYIYVCVCMFIGLYVYMYVCDMIVHLLLLLYNLAVCSDIRKHEDGWIFVDPVTDDIAPGYSEVIKVSIQQNFR